MRFEHKNKPKYCRYYLGPGDSNPFNSETERDLYFIWQTERQWTLDPNGSNFVSANGRRFRHYCNAWYDKDVNGKLLTDDELRQSLGMRLSDKQYRSNVPFNLKGDLLVLFNQLNPGENTREHAEEFIKVTSKNWFSNDF